MMMTSMMTIMMVIMVMMLKARDVNHVTATLIAPTWVSSECLCLFRQGCVIRERLGQVTTIGKSCHHHHFDYVGALYGLC